MVAGLGFVLGEPDPILDGLDLLSCTGLARPLEEEPAATRDELAWSPGDERIVAVGIDGGFDACRHRVSPGERDGQLPNALLLLLPCYGAPTYGSITDTKATSVTQRPDCSASA